MKQIQFKKVGKLFYNDKFLIVFSVFTSLVLWVVLAASNTEDHPRVISNVPIVINLSNAAQQDGLKVFSPIDETATVSIKGNSMIVNQIKSGDLQIVAPLASTITAPGNYTFDLTVQKNGTLTNFDVDTISPNQVIISVDRYKEKTFQIETDIKYKPDYKSDPSYFVGAPTLNSDTVTISGPEKEISQVNKVEIQYEVSETLKESKSFTSELLLFDANGNRIVSSKLKMSETKVDVVIPVLSRRVLPLDVNFTNKPEGLILSPEQVSINPQNVEIAGPLDSLSNLTLISLSPIDFASVSPTKNTFNVNVTLPAGCKNLSSTPVAKVTLDLGNLSTRSMSVNNFTVKNLASDKSANIYTKSITVTVVGPESEISKLTENNLVAQIDMAEKENFTGHTEMPATVSVSGAPSSWVYGSYMANVNIVNK